eukprot:TRINITY_DN9119_c0_g1_i1.p1 TRINITY_DN9119_c0_g1~~TRINITY_DN9119_c0_g1_i1.p1  ORF type:complete len:809 (+),score=179.45 TRINITY_DN9119_c0_g1_i1:70-2496(+)
MERTQFYDYDMNHTPSSIDDVLNGMRSPNHLLLSSYRANYDEVYERSPLKRNTGFASFGERAGSLYSKGVEFLFGKPGVLFEDEMMQVGDCGDVLEEDVIDGILGMVISPDRAWKKNDIWGAHPEKQTAQLNCYDWPQYHSLPSFQGEKILDSPSTHRKIDATDVFQDFHDTYFDSYPSEPEVSIPPQTLFYHSEPRIGYPGPEAQVELDYHQFQQMFQKGRPEAPETPKSKVEVSAKGEPQISPNSKQDYKEFHKIFKLREKEGFTAALNYATCYLDELPKVHWKILLDIADLCKRHNEFGLAREYFERVNSIEPYIPKGWLEYAKMEEENGDLEKCNNLLLRGLEYCPSNEALLIKAIKHCERIGLIQTARSLLGNLKNVSIDRCWRIIMEGGLLEERQGQIDMARKIFKFLMNSVPTFGPIYTEAINLELRIGDYQRAMKLIQRGILKIPSYGPLWFLSLEITEILGGNCEIVANQALANLSQELTWKIHFKMAEIYLRGKDEKSCRKSFVNAVINCPPNLLWKVWLGGAQSELQMLNFDEARRLLISAYQQVPEKMKATVLLEMAKAEEYMGDIEKARYLLKKAKKYCSSEWKVHLEAVLLEIRSSNLEQAYIEVRKALKIHNSTGRLWALYIQLTHLLRFEEPGKFKKPLEVFVKALETVPKSGEVWCEGARLAIHSGHFEKARQYLEFAVQFTPQYGDSFIEAIRLTLLLTPKSKQHTVLNSREVRHIIRMCLNSEPTYGICWSFCQLHPLEGTRQCMENSKKLLALLMEQEYPLYDLATYFATMDVHNLEDPILKYRIIYT